MKKGKLFATRTAFGQANLLSMMSAAALLAASPLAAQGAGSTPVAATASLKNLSFQLVDLNLNDGIAPSVQFDQQSQGRLYGITGLPEAQFLLTGLQPNGTTSVVSVDGGYAVSASPSSMDARNAITMNAVLGAIQDSHTYQASYGTPRVEYAGGFVNSVQVNTSNNPPPPPTFSLSGNTALVISGTASLRFEADLLALQAQLKSLGVESLQFSSQGTAQVIGHGYLDDGQGNAVGAGSASLSIPRTSNYFIQYLNPYGLSEPMTKVYDSGDVSFSFQVQNLGAMTRQGYLDFTVAASSSLSVGPVFTDSSPGLLTPEPSAYALTGLGLLAAVCAARRRRG